MPAGAGRGTILNVPVLLLLAGVVILAGVVAVAMGRGGEMTEFATDSLPPTLDGVVTAADVAMLRPPSSLWGYNVPATDEALHRIAQALTERDVEIAVLRQQLAEFRAVAGSHPAIAATLLARSKAAAARGDTSGPGAAPRRVASRVAWEPGSDAGPAGTGPAGTGPAGMGPAGTGPAGMGPAGTGSADMGPADVGPAGVGSAGVGAAGAGSPANGSAGSVSAGSASPGSASAGAVSEEAAASRDD
jgi:hypothetical protein